MPDEELEKIKLTLGTELGRYPTEDEVYRYMYGTVKERKSILKNKETKS